MATAGRIDHPADRVREAAGLPTPEWGAVLNEARADRVNAPHVALSPSLAIVVTVLAFKLLGDGLRDALDAKTDRR